jgi:hypothetical protein
LSIVVEEVVCGATADGTAWALDDAVAFCVTEEGPMEGIVVGDVGPTVVVFDTGCGTGDCGRDGAGLPFRDRLNKFRSLRGIFNLQVRNYSKVLKRR